MEPLEFLLGVAAFKALVMLKKPIRKLAVLTTSQAMGIVDKLKSAAYGFKEEIEDIVAEAQYENMKRNMENPDEEDLAEEHPKSPDKED